MNDLKTAERSRLGQANLAHLMIWHMCTKDQTCAQLSVRAILDEFMRLASRPSRAAKASWVRGTQPPEYEYHVRVGQRGEGPAR